MCYLKCVRCLWMSRSRMGVGLEEPRGERSWLSKSWNSLQICLTDRGREGNEGFTICLQHSRRNLFLFLFPRAPVPIILDQATHESLPGNNRRQKERDEFNVDAETSETLAHNVIPEVLQMWSERCFFNIVPGCLPGFQSALG